MLTAAKNTRNTEIISGIFALLSGLSLIATILTRFEFISFFSSYSEDLEYLLDNLYLLRINSNIWMLTAFLLTVSASTFIVLLNPYHKFFSLLTGFMLILASAMLCVAAIKGYGIIDLIKHFKEMDLLSNDSMKIIVYSIAREKDIYINISYSLLGLSFLSLGAFGLRTRRISIFTAIVSIITGLILPIFTSLIPESLLADLGLIAGCVTFMIIGIRLLFTGLEKKKRRRKSMKAKEASTE